MPFSTRPSQERKSRSPNSPRSTFPSSSLLHLGPYVHTGNEKSNEYRKITEPVTSSQSVERRGRRQKQSVRESQKLQRALDGKKPFYLTVDIAGEPHGLGRSAWISEINKLAAGLDPSCTNIRKQAHGDMCIFKDHLNERFEYSREPNENFIRGLVGKAVTRRRADLIKFIKGGGSRPPLFNVDIWGRLEMLATSEQREKKTEHGRQANAARRTLGKTGALGEEGIRERLREIFGKSPDPNEVAEEMQHDKGYGKRKAETSKVNKKWWRGHHEDNFNKDDIKSHVQGIQLQRFNSDEDESWKQEYVVVLSNKGTSLCTSFRSVDHGKAKALQRKESVAKKHTEEMPGGSNAVYRTSRHGMTDKYSKDDYIAELEAQLLSLRGNGGKKPRSSRIWSSTTGVDPEEDGEA